MRNSFLLSLPQELTIEVLGRLSATDLASALASCRGLARLREAAWRAACFQRWPEWAAIAAEPAAQWRRQFELLSLREGEAACLPSAAAVRKLQSCVTDRHRSILSEWLCEVSFDWELDSMIVFKAVAYLDHYLGHHAVQALCRFQLLGLACLRAAMGDGRKPTALDEHDKMLDPSNFAHISDNTYTADEVEAQTQVIVGLVPERLKTAANPKMLLRTFWYRATLKEVVLPDEMHIYVLAGFLLQLSLLDLECSSYAPSLVAAAALSTSLTVYGKPAWPQSMQQFGSYLPSDLAPVQARLIQLQASQAAEQLRPKWRSMHEEHAYPEYDAEWRHAILAFSCASRLGNMPAREPRAKPAVDASSAPAASGGTDSPAPPHPVDAAAMLTD